MTKKALAVTVFAAMGLFTLAGCGEKTTGEKVDDAMDKAADKADDAKDDAKKAIDDLGDK